MHDPLNVKFASFLECKMMATLFHMRAVLRCSVRLETAFPAWNYFYVYFIFSKRLTE